MFKALQLRRVEAIYKILRETHRQEEGGTYLPREESIRPMTHIRMVRAGMSGSSMLETEARTSGYGLSSS
jgi:hypothetical protein